MFKKNNIFIFLLSISLLFVSCSSSHKIEETKIDIPDTSNFEIHYIDVGQADAALLISNNQAILIDGGNVADSSLIYSYLNSLGVSHIDYMIATHPHEDHIGGLSGALNACTVETVYSPVLSYDSQAFSNFKKYVEQQGKNIEIPKENESFDFGDATVKILYNGNSATDTNNQSIVLKVVYGQTSFLFTGDIEKEAEQYIINHNIDISATVIKVPHHGSNTSSSYVFIREIMPEIAIISVGKDNSYKHPDEAVLSRYKDADTTVYRTDINGNIIIKSDGSNISISTEKKNIISNSTNNNNDINNLSSYIGNKNSKKFHLSTCNSLPKEENRVYLNNREEAISSGYSPCGNCNP